VGEGQGEDREPRRGLRAVEEPEGHGGDREL
jgi:hypothetical protein